MSKQEDLMNGIIAITKSRPMAYQLIRYLHSQGVVIRVERELLEIPLPHTPLNDKDWDDWQNMVGYFVGEAGYIAVEPLIEEKD